MDKGGLRGRQSQRVRASIEVADETFTIADRDKSKVIALTKERVALAGCVWAISQITKAITHKGGAGVIMECDLLRISPERMR